MDKEMKPCPFCGTSDLLGFEPSQPAGWTIVRCRRCGCSGPTGRSESEQEAIAWWNRRPAPVIEMPDKFSPDDCGEWAYWEGPLHAAIEAAGVKMK